MGFSVDGFEPLDADLGGECGGFELFVAKELLDEADVGTAFEYVDGAGVSDQMTTAGTGDSGLFDKFADYDSEHDGGEWLAVAGEEVRGRRVRRGIARGRRGRGFCRGRRGLFGSIKGRIK